MGMAFGLTIPRGLTSYGRDEMVLYSLFLQEKVMIHKKPQVVHLYCLVPITAQNNQQHEKKASERMNARSMPFDQGSICFPQIS